MTNLSLCSGYGGLDLAVEQVTGTKTLAYAENDKYAAQVMAARFPHADNLGDIRHTDWAEIARQYQIETITAGFPCQGLSNAGLRKGLLDARSAVWKNVLEAVRVIRPRYVFLENVAAIRSRGLGEVVADLAAIGYGIRWTCVRAGEDSVGAPHPRDRWFGLAYPAAEDPDVAAWRERWAAASGEAQGGRARSDTGGRGGVPAADANDRLATEEHQGADCIHGERPALRRGAIQLTRPDGGGEPRDGRAAVESAGRRGSAPGEPGDLEGAASVNWGPYGPAIRRWESILGRPAPAPTEPGVRGNRRLTPVFVEWLMGLPEGWVTGLGLPRNQQLKILGNGVVTRQAVEGYRRLLCADLDAMAA